MLKKAQFGRRKIIDTLVPYYKVRAIQFFPIASFLVAAACALGGAFLRAFGGTVPGALGGALAIGFLI